MRREIFLSLTGHGKWAGHHSTKTVWIKCGYQSERTSHHVTWLSRSWESLSSKECLLFLVLSEIVPCHRVLSHVNRFIGQPLGIKGNILKSTIHLSQYLKLQYFNLVCMNGRKEVPAGCLDVTQTTMRGPRPAPAQSGRQSLHQPWACLGNPAE